MARPCVITGMLLQILLHVAAIHRYRAWRVPVMTNVALTLHCTGSGEKRKAQGNRDENKDGEVMAEGE